MGGHSIRWRARPTHCSVPRVQAAPDRLATRCSTPPPDDAASYRCWQSTTSSHHFEARASRRSHGARGRPTAGRCRSSPSARPRLFLKQVAEARGRRGQDTDDGAVGGRRLLGRPFVDRGAGAGARGRGGGAARRRRRYGSWRWPGCSGLVRRAPSPHVAPPPYCRHQAGGVGVGCCRCGRRAPCCAEERPPPAPTFPPPRSVRAVCPHNKPACNDHAP